MSGFNTIKKSRKRSHEIEEKLNVLNRELEKTKDIHEIAPTMSTSGIYFATINQANQDHSDFEAVTTGGQGLGFSGADGNTAGNASIGDSSGFSGVALSPPHPVTGVRNSAVHYTTGLGDSTPLRPGVTITRGFSDNPPSYTMGSCLWFFDSDFDNGAGQPAGKWCNLEYSNFDGSEGQWFFWDTVKSGQFAGLYIINTDLSQHPCGDISGLISGLNFPGDGGAIGPAFNTVNNSKGTGDADQYPPLPFGDSISDEAFDALDELAMDDMDFSDDYFYIKDMYGTEAAEWFRNNPGKTGGNPFIPKGAPLPFSPFNHRVQKNTNDPLVAGSLSGPRNAVNYPGTPGRPHPGPGYKWYPDANYGKGGYLPVPIRLSSYEPKGKVLSENVYMALLHRGIKPTERDYIKRGIKTPEQKKIFDQRVKRVESYVRKHPDKLEYVMKRYPKSDPRLSMLNYKMDKMTEASDKYLETQFPTNQDLFTKVKDRTKKNMNLTDPKNFKPVKDPIKYVDVKKTKKLKETVTRHFNKPVKSKSIFGLKMSKIKKTNQKMIEKREQEQRKKEEERAYIQEKMENKKYNWKESFTNVTVGMKVGQTFVHNPSGQTVTTAGALGGVETISSTVSIFGDEIPGPDASQYGLQGYAKPMNIMKRKDPEDTNKKLDASQEFAKKVNADVMMNARVDDPVDSALLSDLGYKSTEDILGEVGDQWTYLEYMAMLDAIAEKAAAKSLPITKKILEYSPTGKTPGDVPISLIDAQEAITNARNKAEQALHQAWERYNKVPDLPDGGDKSSLLDNIASKMKVGTAKNVFDLHLNYLKNPTGKVQNINNLISKKDINALSKTITNNATIDQLKFDVRGLYGVLQNTINQNSGLRNSLGNLDQSKIYLNDSQTEVVIEKPYDFGGFFSGDFVGGDTKSALGAPAYAGLNVLQGKMSVKDFFKGTDTMMIRVKVPIKKKNKKKI